MNKEFVPYDEALALKELGFDEPCLGAYFIAGKQLHICEYIKDNKYMILAPTFSQLFRWFREKHKFHSNISSWRSDDDLSFYHEFEIYSLESVHSTGNMYFTYEEAELACLKKLIELV